MRIIIATLTVLLVSCGGGGGRDAETDEQEDGVEDAADGGETECSSDEECSDGLFCEGVERCVDGVCEDGDPPCDDDDPCTVDECDESAEECTNSDLDEDEDGYAAAEGPGGEDCGGTDCDDADPDINPGGTPSCDSADDMDCNGIPDPDNDDDGYVNDACTGGDDCDDADAAAHPGGTPACSGDHDCNGIDDDDNDDDDFIAEGCGGDDCIDSDPLSFPRDPGSEYGCLDGLDNNCDDIVDNPVRITLEDVQVAWGGSSPDRGQHPGIAWAGSLFAVAYDSDYDVMSTEEYRDIYSYSINPNGTWRPLSTSEFTDDEEFDFKPVLAWTGSELAVAWMRQYDLSSGTDRGIYFQTCDAEFDVTGHPTRALVSDVSTVDDPTIAWTGSEFGLCWRQWGPETDSAQDIYCNIVDRAGTARLTPHLHLGAARGDMDDHWPDLAWSGSEFAVTWQVENDAGTLANVAFAIMTPDGTAGLTSPAMLTSVTSGLNVFARVAWAGSAWAVTWTETVDYSSADVQVVLVDGTGTALGTPVLVPGVPDVSVLSELIWTGSVLGISWTDRTDAEVYVRPFDGSLAPLADPVQLSYGTGISNFAAMTWSGSQIGVVWEDSRHGSPRIFMNRIGFCD